MDDSFTMGVAGRYTVECRFHIVGREYRVDRHFELPGIYEARELPEAFNARLRAEYLNAS